MPFQSRLVFLVSAFVLAGASFASDLASGFLVKFKSPDRIARINFLKENGGTLELVSEAGNLFKWTTHSPVDREEVSGEFAFLQENHPIHLPLNPSIESQRAKIVEYLETHPLAFQGLPDLADEPTPKTKPEIQNPAPATSGLDPLLAETWAQGILGATSVWTNTPAGKGIIVAVTDTGIDYNHEDLIDSMWRNPGEVPNDEIDNDNNGYIDDIVGWDFSVNDNKPFDITTSLVEVLLKRGNPGHGTHTSGCIVAGLNNSLGTAGIAPNAKLMALRFMNEWGKGDSAGAIKAIDYAVANGANIISASWGTEGEDEGDHALREAVQRAEKKGVLFIAAAGNGRVTGGGAAVGYSNDTDPKPSYPATYPYPNIISVGAIDSAMKLGGFSNFGPKTVHIAAPGVKIFSTVPGGKYQDTIANLGETKVTWDGTSMATPFVSGAAAVIWSIQRDLSWDKVRALLLTHAVPVPGLSGKVSTGGRLDVATFATR